MVADSKRNKPGAARVMLTGGGTGGHIYPAIAIADKIRRRRPEAEILFVGTERGLESRIVPQSGYDIRFIPASGWDRRHPLRNLKTARDLIAGSRAASKLLEEFQPDLVVGTGGYVSVPLIRAAQKRGIPTYLHEQNAAPGVANRLLARAARKVLLAYPEARAAFPQSVETVITGNPVRREFVTAAFQDTRAELGLLPGDFLILCFGGSRGAGRINAVMSKAAVALRQIPECRLIFITGRDYYDAVRQEWNDVGGFDEQRMTLLPYADRMHLLLPAADLVVSRAGAITAAEITACGRPSILIPSPNVTGNHQYYNAKALADRGAAVLLAEDQLTADSLTGTILRLMGNRPALNQMAQASRTIGRTDGADAIYSELAWPDEQAGGEHHG